MDNFHTRIDTYIIKIFENLSKTFNYFFLVAVENQVAVHVACVCVHCLILICQIEMDQEIIP